LLNVAVLAAFAALCNRFGVQSFRRILDQG
jgi:hypothetical protein